MDEDKFGLVEKVLKDIENALSKNADLYNFDIVPVDTNLRNKSPVLCLENCLGLESWCIKHVYMYCYSEIMDKHFQNCKKKGSKLTSVDSERLIKLLNVTLLLNPDLSSLWNKRRDMVLKLFLEKSFELQFTRLVLSRKPKCNDAFAYRRWLLVAIFQDKTLQSNCIEHLANEELHLCELASDKSPNNYHSWNHRIWIMKTLSTLENNVDINFFYIKEYEFSERWASRHISDFSCFHYRQYCIKNIYLIDNQHWKLLKNSVHDLRKGFVRVLASNISKDSTVQLSEEELLCYSDDNLVNFVMYYTFKNCKCTLNNILLCRKLEVLFHELVLNNELLRFFKHHETLWYHRRFIIHEILEVMYSYFGVVRQNGVLVKHICRKCISDDLLQKQAKIVRYDSNNIYSSILFKVLVSHEKKFVEERRHDSDNYADRHEKYLKFVGGFSNLM